MDVLEGKLDKRGERRIQLKG